MALPLLPLLVAGGAILVVSSKKPKRVAKTARPRKKIRGAKSCDDKFVFDFKKLNMKLITIKGEGNIKYPKIIDDEVSSGNKDVIRITEKILGTQIPKHCFENDGVKIRVLDDQFLKSLAKISGNKASKKDWNAVAPEFFFSTAGNVLSYLIATRVLDPMMGNKALSDIIDWVEAVGKKNNR